MADTRPCKSILGKQMTAADTPSTACAQMAHNRLWSLPLAPTRECGMMVARRMWVCVFVHQVRRIGAMSGWYRCTLFGLCSYHRSGIVSGFCQRVAVPWEGWPKTTVWEHMQARGDRVPGRSDSPGRNRCRMGHALVGGFAWQSCATHKFVN